MPDDLDPIRAGELDRPDRCWLESIDLPCFSLDNKGHRTSVSHLLILPDHLLYPSGAQPNLKAANTNRLCVPFLNKADRMVQWLSG
jgi:hypothetical protein